MFYFLRFSELICRNYYWRWCILKTIVLPLLRTSSLYDWNNSLWLCRRAKWIYLINNIIQWGSVLNKFSPTCPLPLVDQLIIFLYTFIKGTLRLYAPKRHRFLLHLKVEELVFVGWYHQFRYYNTLMTSLTQSS